jgi:hypothetical protein
MADRVAKRPAGVTRIVPQPDAPSALTAIDVSGLTRDELERICVDRGLSTTGTDAQLRTRITTDVAGS